MNIADMSVWVAHFGDPEFENNIPHFYLDSLDNLTAGIGCRIFDVSTLRMLRRSDNGVASVPEMMAERDAIQALPAGQSMAFYRVVTKLYLAPEDVITLFGKRLQLIAEDLENRIGSIDVPTPAEMAIVDMAFNLGPGRLVYDFPKFINAFKARDWRTCSLECKRLAPVPPSRNAWTRAQFEGLVTP